jgi:hypothetical protein
MDELKAFEVRYRWSTDTSWERTDAEVYKADTDEDPAIFCKIMLNSIRGVKEIRWNWKGSLQGHYLSRVEE